MLLGIIVTTSNERNAKHAHISSQPLQSTNAILQRAARTVLLLLLLLCTRPTVHDTNTARGLTDKMHNMDIVHDIIIFSISFFIGHFREMSCFKVIIILIKCLNKVYLYNYTKYS